MSNATQIAEWVKNGEEFSRMTFESFERQYPQLAGELLVQCSGDLEKATVDKAVRVKNDGITYGVTKDKYAKEGENPYMVWRNKPGTIDKPKTAYTGGGKKSFKAFTKSRIKEYRCTTLGKMNEFLAEERTANPTNKWSHVQIIPAGVDEDSGDLKEPYAVVALYETL